MNITGSIGTEQDPQEQRRIYQKKKSRIHRIRVTTGTLKDPLKQSRIYKNILEISEKERLNQEIAWQDPKKRVKIHSTIET
jgi:hypothetical protein